MSEPSKLQQPWLVAVWPGMGGVALTAGYYLMAKLGMHELAELPATEFFDVEHVEVKAGLLRTGRLPRSRLFVWRDPRQRHDIIVFIGEAQPPTGKLAFCRQLIDFAQQHGVQRVFTFAAMATQMHPNARSRVFGATTDEETLQELTTHDLEIVQDGHIGGLNGVLLGVAANLGLQGACLLGEMPHVFANLPFPKASLAVLDVFCRIADIELDFTELAEQAHVMEEKLGEALVQMERTVRQHVEPEEEGFRPEPAPEDRLSPEDEQRIEHLFELARDDRSKAYELKSELDRLDRFEEYEDRFLDLFKQTD